MLRLHTGLRGKALPVFSPHRWVPYAIVDERLVHVLQIPSHGVFATRPIDDPHSLEAINLQQMWGCRDPQHQRVVERYPVKQA